MTLSFVRNVLCVHTMHVGIMTELCSVMMSPERNTSNSNLSPKSVWLLLGVVAMAHFLSVNVSELEIFCLRLPHY